MTSKKETEIETAIRLTKDKVGIEIPTRLAIMFTDKMADKKERMPFGEAIRYSLNEMRIFGKEERKPYATLAGYYFGNRGNLSQARVRAGMRPPKQRRPKPSTVGRVSFDKNGQGKFDI